MGDIADDGLASGIDMDMLNPHSLFASAPELGKGLNLGDEGPLHLGSNGTISLRRLPGRRLHCPLDHIHRGLMSGIHLHRQHCLDLVLRSDTVHNS
jgi:hypothetical protein